MKNIYVAPNGVDSNEGNIDFPILTVQEAKKRVLAVESEEVNVIFRGGIYPITETILFHTYDGGSENKKVTYKAYENEVPVFSSAKSITDWIKKDPEDLPEQSKGRVYMAKFPEGVDKILTVFDGEECVERCHSDFVMPEIMQEYKRMDSLNVSCEEERHLLKRVDFKAGFLKQRDNMEDVELRFMPVPWTMNLLPLEKVDEENNVGTLGIEATTPLSGKPDGMRVENDIMYLTTEGQFCTNSKKREIYYLGDPTGKDFKTPTVKCYFFIEGNIDYEGKEDVPVENLHFEGLEFAYGLRDTTEVDYKGSGIQHDWEMFDKTNSLIRFRGAKGCSFTGCHIHSTSATAIRLDLYCQKMTIKNNLLDNIGNMGILLCGYGPGTKDVNKYNLVTNNIITRCGAEIWHGHAIFLWQSGENMISHNTIHHSARKGVGLCGVRVTILEHRSHTFDEATKSIRWNEIDETFRNSEDEFENYLPYLHTRNNLIEKNNIYKVLEKIGDGSAINVSGAGDGNIIRENYIHHIPTYFSSSTLRTDDWQCGTLMERNVIYKSNISAITRKNYNHLVNNFMIDTNVANGYVRFASYPNEKANYGSIIKNNIYYDSEYEFVPFGKGYLVSEEATLPENCEISNNLFYSQKGNSTLEKHLKENNEKGSKIGNPLFRDIEKGDFRFQEDSFALQMGIDEIDVSTTGVSEEYPERLRKLEYIGSMDDDYERGSNPNKKNYNWW
ncbi:MAG: right-handed parallel beta-helix repeat-containing protein [Eubacteriales bacterium]